MTNFNLSLTLSQSQNEPLILIGTIILLILLVVKEVVSTSADPRLRKFNSALNFSLLPLFCAFTLVLIVKVSEVLR